MGDASITSRSSNLLRRRGMVADRETMIQRAFCSALAVTLLLAGLGTTPVGAVYAK